MHKTYLTIFIAAMFLILATFAFFAAFHYCKGNNPERVFLSFLGVMIVVFGIITILAISTHK